MPHFRRIFLFSVGLLLVFSFCLFVFGSYVINAQNKPQNKLLIYSEINAALISKLPNKTFKNKTELINWLIITIKQRRVDKPLTADREEDLRQAGANNELIEVIRANSPSLSKPTSTPTPKIDSGNIMVGTVRKTTLPGGVEMSFAYIPSGSFEMGSTTQYDEKPIHTVKISQGFQMQTTEITQAQWKSVMGALPSKCDYGELKGNFLGDNKPIICVSWDDAQEFIRQMNLKNDGYKYRLPTEAEWEYAARSGTTGNYVGYLDGLAWYDGNSGGSTHDVATKQANAWGLFDMHGNVSEWCQDWYESGYYAKSPATDPTGATSGSNRMYRGGKWFDSASYLRSAFRNYDTPSYRGDYLGFRVVRQ